VMGSGCRVCHSVGAAGSMLVVQHGDSYGTSSAYTLATTGNTEHVMTHNASPTESFPPAMYADGSMALNSSGVLLPLPTDTTPITTTGLPLSGGSVNLGQPAFSPDGTKIAFNPSTSSLTNNQTLYVMAFNKATMAFSAATLVASDVGSAAQVKPGWPAFFPDSNSIVYHHQVLTGIENDLGTRAGNQAQIYWTSITSSGAVTPMAKLNGVGYLPKLAAPSTMKCTADGYEVAAGPSGTIQPNLDHSQDATMSYEPTVNPIASGGYAWVVFTSRRMYGNVATIPPYCSDPRGVNLAVNTANPLATNITTKKLWVAAIDLNQAPGTDSSHPAFYLPGQELIAGNSRGFWSLDPCEADGTSCTTGDECCGGYCEPNASNQLVCASSSGGCSTVGNMCTTATDCCDANDVCVNGFCTLGS
jgi:WD40-like Beta Propeller Repeat